MDENQGLNGEAFRKRETIVWTSDEKNHVADPSDKKSQGMIISPIQLGKGPEDLYFGNLGVSSHQRNFFRVSDFDLVQGLAQRLAVTWHRLQIIERAKELQEQNQQAEIMSTFGIASYDFAHRLGNDLGFIRSHVGLVRRRLEKKSFRDSEVERRLEKIAREDGGPESLQDRGAPAPSGPRRAG